MEPVIEVILFKSEELTLGKWTPSGQLMSSGEGNVLNTALAWRFFLANVFGKFWWRGIHVLILTWVRFLTTTDTLSASFFSQPWRKRVAPNEYVLAREVEASLVIWRVLVKCLLVLRALFENWWRQLGNEWSKSWLRNGGDRVAGLNRIWLIWHAKKIEI